jgi:hypothetical protein
MTQYPLTVTGPHGVISEHPNIHKLSYNLVREMVVIDNIRAGSWEKNYGKCLFLSAMTHCRATVRVPPHKNETSFRQRNCNSSKQINMLGGCLSAAVLLTSINLVCFLR